MTFNLNDNYLFVYKTKEVDTFKDLEALLKAIDDTDLASGAIYHIHGKGTPKDFMLVDTVNGKALYNDLQEALEFGADYRSETITDLIEEKEANKDILTHPEKYSDSEVTKEVKKVFDFIGNEGTERFLSFIKLEPLSVNEERSLQDKIDKGAKSIEKGKNIEQKLLKFKEDLEDFFGEDIWILPYSKGRSNFVSELEVQITGSNPILVYTEDDDLVASTKDHEKSRIVNKPEDIKQFISISSILPSKTRVRRTLVKISKVLERLGK